MDAQKARQFAEQIVERKKQEQYDHIKAQIALAVYDGAFKVTIHHEHGFYSEVLERIRMEGYKHESFSTGRYTFRKRAAMSNETLAEEVRKAISSLCKNPTKFTMSIPPSIYDYDMLFTEMLDRFRKATAVSSKNLTSEKQVTESNVILPIGAKVISTLTDHPLYPFSKERKKGYSISQALFACKCMVEDPSVIILVQDHLGYGKFEMENKRLLDRIRAIMASSHLPITTLKYSQNKANCYLSLNEF